MPAAKLQNPSSSWAQPATTPLDGLGTWIATGNDPAAGAGQAAPAYLYAQVFGFSGSTAVGAVGLLTSPAGKFAVFSARGPDGAPYDAAVPLDWKAGRFYFPLVYQLSPGVWGAWVYDHTASTWVPIGTLDLPSAWAKLAPTATTTAAWFGPTASSCAAYPRAEVAFYRPTGFVGATTTAATLGSTATTPGQCAAETSTLDAGAWAYDRMGTS